MNYYGTSIFFKLDPSDGKVVKYVMSKLDNRIVVGGDGKSNPLIESSYTLPYWIQKGDNNTLWFNEHTGNKIAKFYPLQEKLSIGFPVKIDYLESVNRMKYAE